MRTTASRCPNCAHTVNPIKTGGKYKCPHCEEVSSHYRWKKDKGF